MKQISVMILILLCANTMPDLLYAQNNGGDPLNETPFYIVPADMTYEEYEDANRRLSVGLLLMSIPFRALKKPRLIVRAGTIVFPLMLKQFFVIARTMGRISMGTLPVAKR